VVNGYAHVFIYISLFASKNADKQTERDSKN